MCNTYECHKNECFFGYRKLMKFYTSWNYCEYDQFLKGNLMFISRTAFWICVSLWSEEGVNHILESCNIIRKTHCYLKNIFFFGMHVEKQLDLHRDGKEKTVFVSSELWINVRSCVKTRLIYHNIRAPCDSYRSKIYLC